MMKGSYLGLFKTIMLEGRLKTTTETEYNYEKIPSKTEKVTPGYDPTSYNNYTLIFTYLILFPQ